MERDRSSQGPRAEQTIIHLTPGSCRGGGNVRGGDCVSAPLLPYPRRSTPKVRYHACASHPSISRRDQGGGVCNLGGGGGG